VNWKNHLWRCGTAFVVVLIILNLEMVYLAIFVDAIGLEMFVMLLEIQVIAIFGLLLNAAQKPILAAKSYLLIARFITRMFGKMESYLMVVTGQAALMHLIVTFSVFEMAINAL
jgi:hypothetical protein